MDVEMRMPALGAVDDAVKILKWLVDVGQMIERGQPLVEVETDKSIMELESAVTGLLHSIRVPAGREAAAGEVIATFAVEHGRQTANISAGLGPATTNTDSSAIRGVPVIDRSDAGPILSPPAGDRVSFFERNRRALRNRPPCSPPPITHATSSWTFTGRWS